jgi:hypothetical protein
LNLCLLKLKVMRIIKIYCKKCNAKLTDELQEMDSSLLRSVDNSPIIDKNKFAIQHNDEFLKGIIVAIDNYYLMNHKDKNRFSGCCGSSGSDGMNKTCSNGHEVATEFSDCYLPHGITFNFDRVIVKEKMDDYNYVKINF